MRKGKIAKHFMGGFLGWAPEAVPSTLFKNEIQLANPLLKCIKVTQSTGESG